MAHLAVVAPPFPSHFRALQAVAGPLLERGHRVTFLHQPDAARWLDDSRIAFHALGEDTHPTGSLGQTLRLAASPGGPIGLYRLIHDMARTTDMLCRTLPSALDALGVDALICDQMEAAGGLVAEGMGRPFVSVACALPINREAGLPLPVMPFGYGTDIRIIQGSERVHDLMMTPLNGVVSRHAREFGLSPRQGLHECLSPQAQISQTIPGFDFPRQSPPGGLHHLGPLRPAPVDERALGLAVADDKPLVFASLGTLQGHRLTLFRRMARACRALGVQLLIAHCGALNARQSEMLYRDGATWVTDSVPQRAAIARADAVITHGGMNTVMDALSARTPLLVLPLAFDQPGVAARIEYTGVGVRVSPHTATVRRLRNALKALLESDRFTPPLARLGREVDEAGGSLKAAGIVEHALTLTDTPMERSA
ncbi:glycosyltransferase [Litchfieldella xinjiangensis]|uniref:glycosyltransferase n=1 Tax=Litchfieldella xinjiangensis TaxID=1166948 RepID=UPI0005BBFDAF|nr:nucleotide disphospho-sugar-binding domain-containing protein [Halomonas xinjiangensis]